ncbi:hypothetical protein Moror_4928 [Moniliophthora roreri MCA 2997]|uniref:Uncharacterized protein n=2 Tax=Moniliophthora roreri TaxID=221103 RepID=V2X1W5_MONRO|nr:hypothetical protein Moror_4928 [Moniliophthora roreri MCA 2997]KAI3603309.1 hypothetical protein WG66_002315 [Moniliophthora roreri]
MDSQESMSNADNTVSKGVQIEDQRSSIFLPQEILQKIFEEHLIFPPTLIDMHSQTWRHPAYRQNMKTKTSLIFVCRDWYNAAIHLLYRDVSIWHLVELDMFIHTLQSSPRSLGTLVKEISLAFLIPSSKDPGAARRILINVLQSVTNHCPNLSKLALVPLPDIDGIAGLAGSFEVTGSEQGDLDFCSRITDLRLGGYSIPALGFEPFIPLTHTVETLTLNLECPDDRVTLPIPAIEWKSLRWFRYWCPSARIIDLDNLSQSWNMPRLERFSVLSTHTTLQAIYRFVSRHGQNLDYMNIHWDVQRLQVLLDRTPKLRHLVLTTPRSSTEITNTIVHATLQWLDTWDGLGWHFPVMYDDTYWQGQGPPYAIDRHFVTQCKLPMLKSFRMFDSCLLASPYDSDLSAVITPDVFHPENGADIAKLRFLRVETKQDGDFIMRNDMVHVEEGFDIHSQAEQDEADDSDYVYCTDSSDSDYETDESACDSLCDILCTTEGSRPTTYVAWHASPDHCQYSGI